MSSVVFDLTQQAKKRCREYGVEIGEQRLKRIVLRVVKRMEREAARRESVETTDLEGFSVLGYHDPTGETAVRNVLRELVSG